MPCFACYVVDDPPFAARIPLRRRRRNTSLHPNGRARSTTSALHPAKSPSDPGLVRTSVQNSARQDLLCSSYCILAKLLAISPVGFPLQGRLQQRRATSPLFLPRRRNLCHQASISELGISVMFPGSGSGSALNHQSFWRSLCFPAGSGLHQRGSQRGSGSEGPGRSHRSAAGS